jgi:hypothetical protein
LARGRGPRRQALRGAIFRRGQPHDRGERLRPPDAPIWPGLEIDPAVDAGYIAISSAAVARTEQFSTQVLLDVDVAEALTASKSYL